MAAPVSLRRGLPAPSGWGGTLSGPRTTRCSLRPPRPVDGAGLAVLALGGGVSPRPSGEPATLVAEASGSSGGARTSPPFPSSPETEAACLAPTPHFLQLGVGVWDRHVWREGPGCWPGRPGLRHTPNSGFRQEPFSFAAEPRVKSTDRWPVGWSLRPGAAPASRWVPGEVWVGHGHPSPGSVPPSVVGLSCMCPSSRSPWGPVAVS